MHDMIVNEEQEKVLAGASGPVRIRNRSGKCLGYVSISPELTPDDLAEFKRRAASDEPRHTTQQVIDHLRKLETP